MMRKIASVSAVTLGALIACSSNSANDAGLTITMSGEAAALTGYDFPAVAGDELTFVDGWAIQFDRILATVDTITLSDSPDTNPTDQSQTGGVVATAHSPWAVDLSRPGAVTKRNPRSLIATQELLQAQGKDTHAQSLTQFATLASGSDLDPDTRYAFGFQTIAATTTALQTNFDAAAAADYTQMITDGDAVLYVGTATFKGTNCTSSDATYDFSVLPKSVHFRLGFKTPTSYVNCQNTDLQGAPFTGEEAERGIQVQANGSTVAQITLHIDHAFWNTVDHDAAELYFDQFAAAADNDGNLTLDDLAKLDFTAFKDKNGKNLPWRSCLASQPVPAGTRAFDPGSVAVNPTADPSQALRNYADYVRYQQSTQGHLNADGLCAVERHFAAPR